MPPHQILVYDESGRDVAGVVGPLLENDNLVLTCEVRGGRPEPRVTWLNGNKPLKTGTGVAMARHVTVNRLEINSIGREQHNTTYICQATNTILVPAAERTIRIEMLCKFFFISFDFAFKWEVYETTLVIIHFLHFIYSLK